jgi:hypothetical protein
MYWAGPETWSSDYPPSADKVEELNDKIEPRLFTKTAE